MWCPFCSEHHYFDGDADACVEKHEFHVNRPPEIEVLIDSDISNPPDWLEELRFHPVVYHRYDPNASWSLPK